MGADIIPAFENHFDNDPLFNDVPFNNLSQTCYDGTWALALALNKTIQGTCQHKVKTFLLKC